jgi:two-component system chemotaxis response regulator CheB
MPSSRAAKPSGSRVRVLVVDDSLVAREMLRHILSSDTGIEVVATAADGAEAVELTATLRPDLVTMDIHMPRMDGIEAIERIMAYTPTPVLVVSSSVHGEGVGRAFDALACGALEVVLKPAPRDWEALDEIARDLVRRVRVLSQVRVITHVRGRRTRGRAIAPGAGARSRSVVAIGASTGGPSALRTVLGGLPAAFPASVLVAQHIADGFIPGLVEWLDAACSIRVRVAEEGAVLEPGVAYVAPTGRDLALDGRAIRLAKPGSGQVHAPSADVLFEGVARVHGASAVGVLLTGMGADGAAGLRALRDAGAATIAQDEATSVVFGMPRAAIELGAAERVLPLPEIAAAVAGLVAP